MITFCKKDAQTKLGREDSAGAKRVRKTCRYEGCTKHVVGGEVCVRHGAKVKTCSYDGCTKQCKRKRGSL